MGANAEFGGLDRVIREAFVDRVGSARKPGFGSFLGASYGSLAGRSLVGIGVILGGGLLVIELFAARDDRAHLAVAAFAAALTIVMIAAPGIAARRAWAAVKGGVRGEAVVTDVTYRAAGDATTIDSIKNGFARGRLHVDRGGEIADHEFESDATWAGALQVGTRLLVVVDRNGRLLANLGPMPDNIREP